MKNVVKVLVAVIVFTTCMSLCILANESNPVTVNLNGEVVDCSSYGQEATIVESRTLVPLRAIFEALGADIVWDDASRTVTSVRGADKVELTIGSNVLYKNSEKVEVDVPAQIMNDRTMVPVRVVAESFGVDVDWDNDTRTVILECDKNTFPVKHEIKCELSSKHIYGEFYYGMTMQNVWDAVGADEGEKSIHALGNAQSEIHIYDREGKYNNEDARIMGDTNCSLVKLTFAGDYLYKITVNSDYLEMEDAAGVREKVAACFGKPDAVKTIGSEGNERDREYIWSRDAQEIVCKIVRQYENSEEYGAKLGNVCVLVIEDKSVEKILSGEETAGSEPKEDKNENKNDEKEEILPDENDDEDGEEDVKPEKQPEEDDEDDEGFGAVDGTSAQAQKILEKYLEACNTFNFNLFAECCSNSLGAESMGIENLGDALAYCGVTKESLSQTMLEKTYKGNEAYKPLTDAVIEVVLDFVSDASDLLYCTVDGVKNDEADRTVFRITHYAPDISVMEEAFAASFDKALKKAFSSGKVSFDMTQDEMMPILADVAAEELKRAFDGLLDKDGFVPSGKENITVVKKRGSEWLVEIDENEAHFIRSIKEGKGGILKLFGFEID